MNPPLSSIDAAPPSTLATITDFCEPARAMITRHIHTQSATFYSIQALAALAMDGASDQQETLFRIDLLARKAAEESECLANAVGTIPAAKR